MNGLNWRAELDAVTRPEDGERIGYLRRIDATRWEPLNVLGIRIGEPASRETALHRVTGDGMASLSRVWWCRAPRPLTEPIVDARTVDDSEEWERMVVVELTPDCVLMRPVYSWPEEPGHLLAIDLPAHDIVREHEPVGNE
jgi:hypothetical protein